MLSLSPVDQQRAFFSALFAPSDLILFRPIEVWSDSASAEKKSRVVYDECRYSPAALAHISLSHLERISGPEHANIFFGVCPREGGGGKFDQAWQIRNIRALWCDIDGVSPAEILERCAAAKPNPIPAPSIVVGSGNGVHLYWLLETPAPITDAPMPPPAVELEWVDKKPVRYFIDPTTNQRIDLGRGRTPKLSPRAEKVQDILQGLAHAIGGDHTFDLSRVLRVPGTLNRKDERNGRQPVPCLLVECDPSRRYPLVAFKAFADASPLAKKREHAAKIPLPMPRKMSPTRRDHLNKLITACELAPQGTRSEKDFDLCCYAIKAAVHAGEVWSLVQSVGKFAEKGRGYFDDTWRAAGEEVQVKEYEKKYEGGRNGRAGKSPSNHSLPPSLTPYTIGSTTPCQDGQLSNSDNPEIPAPKAIKADDDPHRLARLYISRYHSSPAFPGVPLLRYWQEDWWRWMGKRYETLTKDGVKASITTAAEEEFDRLNIAAQADESIAAEDREKAALKVTQNVVANVYGVLKSLIALDDSQPQPGWITPDGRFDKSRPTVIAMENGLLDLERLLGELAHGHDREKQTSDYVLDHTPLWFSPICLPYPFKLDANLPMADCPTWATFLEKNLESDPERIALLQEWAGYLLTPDTSKQKFLAMEGNGGNGKSVVCSLLTALVGEENVSGVTLEMFADKYALGRTIGKLANIVSEVGTPDKIAEGRLKEFTSGDRLSIDRKFKSAIEFRPTARLVMSFNERPRFTDRSAGLWRRLLLLPLNVEVAEADKIPNLDKDWWWSASGELPGVFRWALDGLVRLRENGHFTTSKISAEAKEEYRDEANPARVFLLENYQPHPDGGENCSIVYEFYVNFCKAKGHKALSDSQFGKEVKRAFPACYKSRIRSEDTDTGRVHIYDGITKI